MPHLRDPIHGFIEVSPLEQMIIDSVPFQRLRNIRQLATTYLVYHGAEHTRFGHSIGVMHLVTRAFDSVVSKNPGLFREDSLENEAVIMWYRQILRLMALTHDLGHAPFSHASTELFPNEREHEDYTKDIIEQTEIAAIISNIGTELQHEIAVKLQMSKDAIEKNIQIKPLTPQLIWMIYGEKPKISKDMHNDYIWPDFMFLKSFMDGEMDCDKMDYLLRDSYFCGVSYGKYDLDRFISTLTVYKKPEEKILQLAISNGGIQAFEEFVLARYFMFIQVYFHKTRRYFDHLLVNCLEKILPEGKFPKDLSEYLKWDDVHVLNEMRNSNEACAKQYINRETMSCIQESSAHAEKSLARLYDVACTRINEKLGEGSAFFDQIDKKAHKLLPAILESEDDSGREIKVIDKQTKKARNIMQDSLILDGIMRKINICRIYAKKESMIEAKSIVREMCKD